MHGSPTATMALRACSLTIALLLLASFGVPNGFGAADAAFAAKIEHEELEKDYAAIVISGEIVADDADRFRKLTVQFKDAVVLLDSEGGALLPALEIGKIIRLAGYSTAVGDDATCTSSCALIWLAGAGRLLSTTGKVGFHASYRNNEGRLEETGVGNAMVGHYLTLLNLPQKAIVFATSASPKEIYWLSESNKLAAGIEFQYISADSDAEQSQPAVSRQRDVSVVPPAVTSKAAGKGSTEIESWQLNDNSLEAFERSYAKAVRAPGHIRKLFLATGLPESTFEAFQEHLASLYADDRFVAHVAKQMHDASALFTNEKSSYQAGLKLGEEVMTKLSVSGFTRLDDESIESLFFYLASAAGRLSESECKTMFSGNTGSSTLELKAVADLGNSEFAEYLGLHRRAMKAELSAYPASVALSRQQVELGNQAFQNALAAYLEKQPPEEAKHLATALENLEIASDKGACEGYFTVFKVMYELEGLPGQWSRRNFFIEAAR